LANNQPGIVQQRGLLRFPDSEMTKTMAYVIGRLLRTNGIRAFLVVTDLAGGTFCTAGPAVAGIGAKKYFATVNCFLVAVGKVSLALLNNTFPLHAGGSPRVRHPGRAFGSTGPAVFHIRIQVNARVVA